MHDRQPDVAENSMQCEPVWMRDCEPDMIENGMQCGIPWASFSDAAAQAGAMPDLTESGVQHQGPICEDFGTQCEGPERVDCAVQLDTVIMEVCRCGNQLL